MTMATAPKGFRTIGTIAANMRGVGQYGGQSKESIAYNLHHFACPHCQAAGRLTQGARRCEAGAPLWNAYLQSVLAEPSPVRPHGNHGKNDFVHRAPTPAHHDL